MGCALPHALPKSPTLGERLGWWVTQYHSPCRSGDLENYQLWCPPSTHLPARGRSGATRAPSDQTALRTLAADTLGFFEMAVVRAYLEWESAREDGHREISKAIKAIKALANGGIVQNIA